MTIEEKINELPAESKKEVFDFIDFLLEKNQKKSESEWHLKITEKSLNKVWDNPEDDIYNELLKR